MTPISQEIIANMTDFEKSVYNDVCEWVKTKYGNNVNTNDKFYHFRDLYWKDYLETAPYPEIRAIK